MWFCFGVNAQTAAAASAAVNPAGKHGREKQQ
jgi:hypothetical protein